MTDATTGKTGEAGKAELENFDVEEAIREVRRLGRGLIEATRHAKHHFREEWLEQLIERYKRLPGKPVIHLDDLSDEVVPTLSPSVRDVLYPHWRRLVEEFGYMGSMNRFRVLRDIVVTGRVYSKSEKGETSVVSEEYRMPHNIQSRIRAMPVFNVVQKESLLCISPSVKWILIFEPPRKWI